MVGKRATCRTTSTRFISGKGSHVWKASMFKALSHHIETDIKAFKLKLFGMDRSLAEF